MRKRKNLFNSIKLILNMIFKIFCSYVKSYRYDYYRLLYKLECQQIQCFAIAMDCKSKSLVSYDSLVFYSKVMTSNVIIRENNSYNHKYSVFFYNSLFIVNMPISQANGSKSALKPLTS